MAVDTHVLESGSGMIVAFDGYRDISQFADRLRRFNGTSRFALNLWALPPDMDYRQAASAGLDGLEYIQAAGRSDAMTVEMRKPGGKQWGADWVRYVVGHPHDGDVPLDVPIKLPNSTEMISRPEVFDADEAAQLFYSYYKNGDIPPGYVLRPVEGFTRDGGTIDLRNRALS